MREAVDTLYYYSNDTIICVVNMFVSNNQLDDKSYFYLTFNECLTIFLAIVGVTVAIVQFRTQMAKNREEQKSENSKNWYLSVIVIPQIEGINMFYRKLIEDVLADISVLRSSNSEDVVLLSEKQAIRKEQINAFFDHLQSLIRSFDIPLSRRIASEIEKLEDEVTIVLADSFSVRLFTKNEIRRRLLLNKKDIISILYNKTLESDSNNQITR